MTTIGHERRAQGIEALLLVALFVWGGLTIGCQGPVGPEGPAGPEGPQGATGASGKQVRFHIVDQFRRINYAAPFPVDSLIKFNIDYFPEVDSALFIANVRNDQGEQPVYVDLYNSTDRDTLATLTVMNTEYAAVESENIVDRFPSGEITLTVYLRPNGEIISMTDAWLFLYRN